MATNKQPSRLPSSSSSLLQAKKGSFGAIAGLVISILVLIVMIILYGSQFFAPIAKHTGFLKEEFEHKGPIITDFPVEAYHDLIQETVGEDFVFVVGFDLEVDVGNWFSNEQYTAIKKHTSLRSLDTENEQLQITSIKTDKGLTKVQAIEELTGIVVLFKKQGMANSVIVGIDDDPEIGKDLIFSVPETTPEGTIKMDINGNPLSTPVGKLTVKAIEGTAINYTIVPFVETGGIVT